MSAHATAPVRRGRAATARERVWTRIQDQAPELADWLNECREHFGRPKQLTVEIDGEPVWPPPDRSPRRR